MFKGIQNPQLPPWEYSGEKSHYQGNDVYYMYHSCVRNMHTKNGTMRGSSVVVNLGELFKLLIVLFSKKKGIYF
jgi:hypothetical protein